MKLPEGSGKFRNSFLFRLVAIFSLVAALVVFLVSVTYVVTEIRESRSNNEAMVRLAAAGLAESVRLPLFAGNREVLRSLADHATRQPGILGVAVLDDSGTLVAESRQSGAPLPGTLRTEWIEVRSGPAAVSPEALLAGGADGGGHPIGKVRIEYDSDPLAKEIRRTILFTGGFAFLFWALVSALSYPVFRRATLSFRALLDGLRGLREGNFDLALPVQSADEMGVAAATVNELAVSLKRRDEESRRLHRSLESEIRERTLAEAESREAERTLRQLMDAMPVGVAWSDLDGTVRYMNRYMVERFGYGPDEIRTSEEWIARAYPDPERRRRILEIREAGLKEQRERGGDAPSYEAKVTCRDGSVRDVLVSNRLTKDRLVVIMVDITERESMRERALRAQKLESLGILAGGIAHNFNNVLTAVMGYLSFARRSIDRPERARALLEKAEDASRAAAGIAGQLLTFARGGEPVKKPVSVAKLVEDAVSLSLLGTRVSATVEIPPSTHGIEADEGQLGQAINNILINAVQAMPQGGAIFVRGGNVERGEPGTPALGPGTFIRLSIEDQGCGIPEANRERIFDPYFTTKDGVGTGLGLASVRSIVEKHGGVVTVASEVGKGTTFTLYLPSTGGAVAGAKPHPEAGEPARTADGSILFMDDDQLICTLAREALEHRGYRVTTCAKGEEAIESYRDAKLRGEPFAAVVLDLTIPNGMGGKETAEQVLAFDPDAVLIVSSGYSNDPVMANHREYGFRTAVPKPYRECALAAALDEVLAPGLGAG